jgi:glycine oxidase
MHHHPDVCIAGAGIIGLSLALELHHRGIRVTVFDRTAPLTEASTAAAGMLAAADPHTSPQLHPLANLSLQLYPAFLDQLHHLSGIAVPFQTNLTLQALPPHAPKNENENELTPEDLSRLLPSLSPGNHRFISLDEHSVDPRQLAATLLTAIRATTIDLRPNTPVLSTRSIGNTVEIEIATGTFTANQFVDCTGAWASSTSPNIQIAPKKGQMLAVSLPPALPLHLVVRTPDIYIVPRTSGPNAGRALIGATIEDAGFDKIVHPSDISRLHSLASALLPSLATSEQLEAWAGLRPATIDGFPLLGALPTQPNHFIATGHYRDGILLAPATALVLTQILLKEAPAIDLAPFSPTRQMTPNN